MIYFSTTVDILDFDPGKETHIHKEQRKLFSSHETFTKIANKSCNVDRSVYKYINEKRGDGMFYRFFIVKKVCFFFYEKDNIFFYTIANITLLS